MERISCQEMVLSPCVRLFIETLCAETSGITSGDQPPLGDTGENVKLVWPEAAFRSNRRGRGTEGRQWQ
jgi:hypothetical protein